MKQIKIAVLALFVCSVAVFSVFTIRDFLETKDQLPVIEAEQDTISVPIDATDEQLCAGLRATDAEDGDLTDGSIDMMSLLVKTGLCSSKSDARRNIQQGGVSANDERITDIAKSFAADELKNGVVIRRGKKNYNKIILK